MNNKTAKLIRKSTTSRESYKAAKKSYNKIPRTMRHKLKQQIKQYI